MRRALAIDATSTVKDRTVDITTTGRRSGRPRRIEIVYLAAEPKFTFHLKRGVAADLPATATLITDPAERRRVLADFVEQFNTRQGPDSPWSTAVLDEWVERSPLAKVTFSDGR